MQTSTTGIKADYGIDAPQVVLRFFLTGAAGLLVGLVLLTVVRSHSLWLNVLASTGIWGGSCWMATAALMVFGSKVLKPRLRDRILDNIPWRGNERVLDVGCGRGLMLIGAAKRVANGSVTGIDLWQTVDQSGNSPETTRANALAEGVNDRIEIQTGDARQMPFAPDSFDVVVSSWALHNIYQADGRAQALLEIVRVLKPGGRLALVDIRHAHEYAAVLKHAGMSEVRVSAPNFLFGIPTHVVWARKA